MSSLRTKYRFLVFMLLFVWHPFLLPAGSVKGVLKQIQRKQFAKANRTLSKEISKRPDNAGIEYAYALYYFDPANPLYNIDSSYRYALEAVADYPATADKTKKKWLKLGITAESLQAFKLRIDSLGFVTAQQTNSEEAYQTFLNKYPTAPQREEAIRLRNALAFAEAKQINTYESYKRFLDKYPDAAQVREAKEVSELVLYETQTASGTAESYATFARSYPGSSYRAKAEQMAYLLSTADHSLAAYREFVEKYPDNPYVKQAWAWLLHLYHEDKNLNGFPEDYPNYPDQTYLHKLIRAQSLAYFPVYEEGRYGFLDSEGELQIPVMYDSTADHYFCEGIKEDFILAYRNGQLGALDKTGRSVAPFAYERLEELDKPLILSEKQGRRGIIHQGGFEILPAQFDSVEVLNEQFLRVYLNNRQGLAMMNGWTILEPVYEEITGLGAGFVQFRRGDRYALLTNEQLTPKNGRTYNPTLTFRYNRIEWLKPGFVKVYADSSESIIDQHLRTVIPPQQRRITTLPTAWATQDSTGYRLWKMDGLPVLDSTGRQPVFDQVVASGEYYGVKQQGQWGVLNRFCQVYLPCSYDSVSLITGNIFLLQKKKQTLLHTSSQKLISVPDVRSGAPLSSDPEKATAPSYITLQNRSGKQALYKVTGQQLLPFWYESIRVLSPNLFLVESNRKAALKDSLNKLRLPLSYDGLSPMRKGFVATLKGKKFGVFHPDKKISIQPQYEALLQFYDKEGQLLIARKGGKYGLIDRKNKEVAPFTFDEIRYWLQTVALVRENEQWRLYDFGNKIYFLQPFDEIAYIKSTDAEIVLKVYANQHYGILSSVNGQLIPIEYDDLGNAGEENVPFYIAEKFVEAAKVYLLFYFDANGNPLRKQIFSEAVYEKIVCE